MYWIDTLKLQNSFKASDIVRVTGDCPLADPKLIDKMISLYLKKKPDYLCTSPYSFPDGFDAEIFSFKTLKLTKEKAFSKFDLQHVTAYIKKDFKYFNKESLKFFDDFSFIKLSIDEKRRSKKCEKSLQTFLSKYLFFGRRFV